MSVDVIKLTSSLIKCPSVTPEDGGAFELLEKALKVMRFNVQRKVFEEEGHKPVENFYARLGTQEPHLCFLGHIDVVPPGDEADWKHPPFEPVEENGMLYGRGAEDMKGAIAAFIVSVTTVFAENKGKIPGSISLLITADEEGEAVNGTKKVLEWLKEEGEVFDACLVGEPTNPTFLGEMIKIGRRGSYNGELTVTGKQGHVAYPELAENPVSRLVDMLYTMQYAPMDKGNKDFQPSNLEVVSIDVGNPVSNIIPAKATAKFNIRFNNHFTGESVIEWVRGKCDAVGGNYELNGRVSGEAFIGGDNQELAALLSASVREVTRKKPTLSTSGGTSDARFFKDYCPVVEFGTTGLTAHHVNECVKIADLKKLTGVYTDFIRRFMRVGAYKGKSLEELTGVSLGAKGDDDYNDTNIPVGKGQQYQDTVLEARSPEAALEFSDADLAALVGDMGVVESEKEDEYDDALVLGQSDEEVIVEEDSLDYWKQVGVGAGQQYQDTEIAGGKKQTYMDTEIAGGSGKPDYGFIELPGRGDKKEQQYMDTVIAGRKKPEEAAVARPRIDESNVGNYRNMIKNHASIMLQMLIRKLVYAALSGGGSPTVKDAEFHRKIDQLITTRRRKMIDEVKFVGLPEATAFVDKEIEMIKKVAQSKVPTFAEELVGKKDKLEQFPKIWNK